MRSALIDSGLWSQDDNGEPGGTVTSAWSVLAKLGYPGRYAGRTQDGQHEFAIINIKTGSLLTSGRGETLPQAMCAAALAARSLERQ